MCSCPERLRGTKPPMRILGIDPGLQATGFGVLDAHGSDLLYVASGTIRTQGGAGALLPQRLGVLFAGIQEAVSYTHLTLPTKRIV